MRDPNAVMISFEESLDIVDEALSGARVESERIGAREALGRVLASPPAAQLELPPFDKSAVDGYAFLAGDKPEDHHYELIETVHAGQVGREPLRPGTTVKVMTGAPVPEGADRVVMVEQAVLEDGRVRIRDWNGGRNICRRGEDVVAGTPLLPSGTRIRSIDLANLISCGVREVEVFRPVRVALLSTGNEIVDRPEEIVPGRIMNSNGPMLAALSQHHGLVPTRVERIADDLRATEQSIRRALDQADLVVVTGGVSEGDSDLVAPALFNLGLKVRFTRVAIKPGKPLTFAMGSGAILFGLPGNPVSSYLLFHLYVLRAVGHLHGAPREPRSLRLRLRDRFHRKRAERLEFVPARLDAAGAVESIPSHGSAHLISLTSADGFFQVPRGTADLPADSEVDFLPLGGRLG